VQTLIEALGANQWAVKYTISRAVEPSLTRRAIPAIELSDWLSVV
jgi:hypothetical protein